MSAHMKIAGLTGILGLFAFGCTAAPQASGEVVNQLAVAADLADGIAEIQKPLAETAAELSALEGDISAAEAQVRGFVAGAGTHALVRTTGIADPPPGQVALRLSFAYLPAALPGEGIQAYESTDEVNSLWAMESLPAGAELPVGELIREGTLFFEPGEQKTVTLAYLNPSEAEVPFLVLPHQESPGELAAHVWPTCLCMSFTYAAPPNGAWYRVIKITVGPDAPAGSKIDTVWTVLTDPSVFPEG